MVPFLVTVQLSKKTFNYGWSKTISFEKQKSEVCFKRRGKWIYSNPAASNICLMESLAD